MRESIGITAMMFIPLSGLLAWKMLCDEQERDAHENVAAWLVRAHCIVQEGRKIEHPTALMPWVRAIDTVGDKLLNLDIKADQIASMTIHMVLETIACKHGEKWEPWRAIARELQREMGSKGKAYTWRIISARIKTSWKKIYGDEGLSELAQVTAAPGAASGAHRRRGTNMPSGVALQAMEGNTPQGSTSYEQFMQAGISAGNAHTAGRRDNVRKHENKVAPNGAADRPRLEMCMWQQQLPLQTCPHLS